jgi:hypothetical protein
MQDDPKLEAGGAYLLTWKPDRFDLDLQWMIKQFKRGTLGTSEWATGTTKTMRLGAPFFFLRQGHDHPGIIGWGRICGSVHQQPHWDPAMAKAGKESNEVDVQFEFLTMPDDPKAIPRPLLEADRRTKAGKWDIQGSGTRLTAEVTNGVRALLQDRHVKMPSLNADADAPWVRVETYSEGSPPLRLRLPGLRLRLRPVLRPRCRWNDRGAPSSAHQPGHEVPSSRSHQGPSTAVFELPSSGPPPGRQGGSPAHSDASSHGPALRQAQQPLRAT